MRPSHDAWAMALALETAKRTTCCRRAVGSVLLNARGHVLSTGYNGVAAGMPHCNEVVKVENPKFNLLDCDRFDVEYFGTFPNACSGATSPSGTNLDGCGAVHAEQNSLLQCRDVYDIETCYVTTSPCMTCVKLLMNTSCK